MVPLPSPMPKNTDPILEIFLRVNLHCLWEWPLQVWGRRGWESCVRCSLLFFTTQCIDYKVHVWKYPITLHAPPPHTHTHVPVSVHRASSSNISMSCSELFAHLYFVANVWIWPVEHADTSHLQQFHNNLLRLWKLHSLNRYWVWLLTWSYC